MSLKIMDFVFQNIRESSMWNEHATTKFLTGNKFGKVFVNTNNIWCLFDMFGIVYCVVCCVYTYWGRLRIIDKFSRQMTSLETIIG